MVFDEAAESCADPGGIELEHHKSKGLQAVGSELVAPPNGCLGLTDDHIGSDAVEPCEESFWVVGVASQVMVLGAAPVQVVAADQVAAEAFAVIDGLDGFLVFDHTDPAVATIDTTCDSSDQGSGPVREHNVTRWPVVTRSGCDHGELFPGELVVEIRIENRAEDDRFDPPVKQDCAEAGQGGFVQVMNLKFITEAAGDGFNLGIVVADAGAPDRMTLDNEGDRHALISAWFGQGTLAGESRVTDVAELFSEVLDLAAGFEADARMVAHGHGNGGFGEAELLG